MSYFERFYDPSDLSMICQWQGHFQYVQRSNQNEGEQVVAGKKAKKEKKN